MVPNEQSLSLFESRYKKPKKNLTELTVAGGIPEGVEWDAYNNLQRSQEQLREQASALKAQNKELRAYAHMVSHDLKDPLAALVVTSDLITDIPDLTRRELKEYLGQIRSTAYKMDRIIYKARWNRKSEIRGGRFNL